MGTVSFEVPGPGTYNVTCDPKLDTLADGGTAGDVLEGKQFYNDQNAPVTGTMPNNPPQQVNVAGGESYTIPQGYHDGTGKVTGTGAALPTLADPAGVGDILTGKDAIDQSGAVLTGTMPNNGAVDVDLAAGGTYTVPAGYHNGAGKVKSTAAPLPALTNPGTAGDLLKNKELIDQSGNVVTGTLEPGTDTSDATATAGDILAPKTAYVASGKVTGTIATRGDSDVTANGPTVAVPHGYYPQAVNKTVSDPDLIPANIKDGVEIFGVTGSFSPEYAAKLVVTVEAGAVVTAADGTTTLTETSTGTATFHLPNGGTWTVSAALNGSQASPAEVEVQENFSLALSAGASQTVTVPTQYEAELSFIPTYTVTLSVDPTGSGTVTGAGEYQEGAQATVTADPGDGYEFSAWKESGGSRLPNGYTELEYIQSSGTQYINTKFNPTTKTKSVLDLKIADTAGTFVPFGAKVNSTTREKQYFILAMGTTSRFEANYFSTTEANLVNLSDYKDRGRLSLDGSTISFNNSSASLNYTAGDNEVPYPIYLFGYDLSGTFSAAASMALYSCKIYESGTLARDFVPCSDPSGAVGLYDLVEGKFYANAGTGTFTAGPEVGGDVTVSEDPEYSFTVTRDVELTAVFEGSKPSRLPDGYTEVEYISNPNLGYASLPKIIGADMYVDTCIDITMSYPAGSAGIINTGTAIYPFLGACHSYKAAGTTTRYSAIVGYGNRAGVIGWQYNNRNYGIIEKLNANEKYHIIFDPKSKIVTVNDVENTYSRSLPSLTATLPTTLLFAYYQTVGGYNIDDTAGVKYPNSFYLYSLKVYKISEEGSKEYIYDLVPCIGPSGSVGIYDLVDNTFIGSDSTAKLFVAGPAV